MAKDERDPEKRIEPLERTKPHRWQVPRDPATGRALCDLCGSPMRESHCKLICDQCGYIRDCSDP